jgi:hypothetical protein
VKGFFIFLFILLIAGFVLSSKFVLNDNKVSDIPSPLNPDFVSKVSACGKLDLIDRASVKYNPSALIDGSLKECDN